MRGALQSSEEEEEEQEGEREAGGGGGWGCVCGGVGVGVGVGCVGGCVVGGGGGERPTLSQGADVGENVPLRKGAPKKEFRRAGP